MKIERISDNQIRCTLTKADLEERNIRLTELAYGTEKAKQLFREMMMKAYRECGWTNEGNIPLMIEAIPDHGNALVLLITKVDDPEELDTRFSKFTATDVLPDGEDGTRVEGADDILDVFHKFFDQKKNGSKVKKGVKPQGAPKQPERQGSSSAEDAAALSLTRVYRFKELENVIRGAAALKGFYKGSSSLYRQPEDGSYVLIVHQSSHTPEEFNKICNILSEYGSGSKYISAGEAFLCEHGQTVIANSAVQQIAGIIETENTQEVK